MAGLEGTWFSIIISCESASYRTTHDSQLTLSHQAALTAFLLQNTPVNFEAAKQLVRRGIIAMSRGTTMCSTSLQVFAQKGAPCTTPVLAPAAPRPHFRRAMPLTSHAAVNIFSRRIFVRFLVPLWKNQFQDVQRSVQHIWSATAPFELTTTWCNTMVNAPLGDCVVPTWTPPFGGLLIAVHGHTESCWPGCSPAFSRRPARRQKYAQL